MGKTFHRLHVHLVWATKNRLPILTDEVQRWLFPALAEKARALGSGYVVVGGVEDHIHVLTQFDAAHSIAAVIRHLKGASSRIAHLRDMPEFSWQEGYGAFAVSRQDLERIADYVRGQREHHARGTLVPDLEEFP